MGTSADAVGDRIDRGETLIYQRIRIHEHFLQAVEVYYQLYKQVLMYMYVEVEI
jgi:hypothetical protein